MGQKLSLKQVNLLKQRYGRNWQEVLKTIPTEEERKKLRAKRKKRKKR